ncbi:MAG: DNA-binding protein WhiA [Eubacteriales bacterium]|nr:DNA-binding protein WhiA [Eubacteriales bacterium]
MSFSSEVKKELSHAPMENEHDCAAEIAGFITFGGEIHLTEAGNLDILFRSENSVVAERFIALNQKLGFVVEQGKMPHDYLVIGEKSKMHLLKLCGFMDNLGRLVEEEEIFENTLLQNNTCQRAFLRGAFLACGSITDPEKNYHFEITCNSETIACMLKDQMEFFGLEAKIVLRKKYYVVYMKEGSMISEMLAIMEGHISKLNFENIRIFKDVRNVVNRRVNCETANINKTVSAARKQIEDIEYIEKTIGLKGLPESLRAIASARLEEPSATLKELGERLQPPVGKSGVNHRLRKISQIAQELRDK